MREQWHDVADAVALAGQHTAAAKIEAAVDSLSDAELESVYGNADVAGLAKVFAAYANAKGHLDEALRPTSTTSSRALMLLGPGGFPDAQAHLAVLLEGGALRHAAGELGERHVLGARNVIDGEIRGWPQIEQEAVPGAWRKLSENAGDGTFFRRSTVAGKDGSPRIPIG